MENPNRTCIKSCLSALLIAFLLAGCSSLTAEQPVAPEAILTEDVERGRDLFMGNAHFQNGGPPCMGCHNVGNNGLLGGGALGPDLTNVTIERNPSELTATLDGSATTLSPVMQPIYAEHPLTKEERADLIEFMAASAGQPVGDHELLLYGISIGGFLAVMGLIQFIFRHRLRGVRRPLVNNSHSTN
jgi:mono/diheme cytochrome c family protein